MGEGENAETGNGSPRPAPRLVYTLPTQVRLYLESGKLLIVSGEVKLDLLGRRTLVARWSVFGKCENQKVGTAV